MTNMLNCLGFIFLHFFNSTFQIIFTYYVGIKQIHDKK